MIRKLLLLASLLSFDPSAFNRMDPLMAKGEARVAEVMSGETMKLSYVELESWQRENAVLKAKMGEVPKGEFLTAADLPRGMTFTSQGKTYLVLPSENGFTLKEKLTDLFARMTFETLMLLMIAVAMMVFVAMYLFQRRTLRMVAPVFGAVAITAGILALCGVKFTFFHFIAFFMILGLGIDYAIFGVADARSTKHDARKVIFYSFLTSLVGFGMLSFTSFPPTRMMGVTLALGLFFAWFFAPNRQASTTNRQPPTTGHWSARPEQAAGKIRLWLTFAIYRYLGKSFAKFCALFVVACAYPGFRTRCGFKKALSFAFGLLDKLDACTLRKHLPEMMVVGDTGWMEGGCFLLSTHVGTIEVLPALNPPYDARSTQHEARPTPIVHAFQQMTHNKLFTEMFMKYFDHSQFVLHPVEEIGVETAVEMQEAIQRGEMVLMAGDRDPASGGKKGVFKFAKLMESPVYAITCVRTGWNAYEVEAKKLGKAIQAEYEVFLAEQSARYPNECFNF